MVKMSRFGGMSSATHEIMESSKTLRFKARRQGVRYFAASILLLGTLLALPAAAELNSRWDPLNELGNLGRLEAAEVSPHDSRVLLVGGDVLGGCLSTNAGVTWEQCLGINECSELNDFTFHPTNPRIVWLGTLSGPYQSTDGGRNWTLKRNGMPPLSSTGLTAPIQKVLFDPNNSNTLLAIGGNHRHMGYGANGVTAWGGVWKSRDGGEHWTRLGTIDDAGAGGPDDGTGVLINNAGFAAGSSKIIYACSDQGGVYKSTDGGKSFEKANTGLPNTEAWSLALHPTDPNTLWVGLGSGGTIYKSTDGARTWTRSANGIGDPAKSTQFRTLAVAPSNPALLYCASWTRPASAYRSEDGGANWTRVVDSGNRDTLIGGTGNPGGLFFQWITVDPSDARHLVGACEGDVVQSYDGGSSWKDITCVPAGSAWRGNGFSGLCCTKIEWNPYKPGQVFTLGMDAGKMLRTDDYFWGWKLADPGLIGPYNGANDVSFAEDGTIYLGSGQFGNISGRYTNEPIVKSTNWGASWVYTTRPEGAQGDNKAVYVEPRNSKKVWAIMGNTLYQSADGGNHWTSLSLSNAGTLWNLAVDKRAPGTMYIGARNGVFKSTNGKDFELMEGSPRSSNYEYVYLDPVASEIVYAISFNSGSLGGLYRYNGETWRRILKKSQARALAIEPGNNQRLAVITKGWVARDLNSGDGVWLSEDGGKQWRQCNNNLRMLHGSTIAFNPDKSAQLIVGMDGAGFYVTDMGTSAAYRSKPAQLPGIIQAEDYDRGGEGVAFHSAKPVQTGKYRPDSLGIEPGGTRRVLRGLSSGDWLKYQVNVARTGSYYVVLRVAAKHSGGRVHLEANGVNISGPVAVDNTENKWKLQVVGRKIWLEAGVQYLKVNVEAAGADLDYIRFDRAQ